MSTGRSQRGAKAKSIFNSILRILLLLAILGLISFYVSPRHFTRADLTRDKLYTVTDATKRLLSGLGDNLILRGYFSEDLPHGYQHIPQLVGDVLREYEAYGEGRVKVEMIDPSRDDLARDLVEGLGIKPFPLQDREKDKLVVRKCYLTVAVFYLDRTQKISIPEVGAIEYLEYELSRAIVQVTTRDLPQVGLLVDSEAVTSTADKPAPNPARSYEAVFETLQTQYKVRRVHLKSGQPVPKGIGTLLIVRPRSLSEQEAFEIDQFVMRGGRLAIFADTVEFDLGSNLAETRIDTGLDHLLEHYGFRLDDRLVLDESTDFMTVYRREGMLQLQQNLVYPYFVRILPENLDERNPVVKKLGALSFFWASPIEVLEDRTGDRETVTLARSSDKAWSAESYDNVLPSVENTGWAYYRRPDEENRHQYILAAAQIGSFTSAFDAAPGPPVPAEAAPAPPEAATVEDEKPEKPPREVLTRSPETRIILVGDADIASDSQFRRPASFTFVLNVVDWLTLGNELIEIRSRFITDRTFPEDKVSETRAFWTKVAFILGLPLLVLVAGLVRWILRSS